MAAPSRPGVPNAGPPRAEADIDLEVDHEPTLGELISRTTSDLSQLLRDEVELAKVEIKEEVKTAGRAGALLGAAGLLGYLALGLLCFAAAWALSEVVPEGVAFLIVAAVVGVFAGIAYLMGRKQIEAFEPVPTQTVETIQEDVQWAKQLRS
jgi:uncharacterized membrane protein YqjE